MSISGRMYAHANLDAKEYGEEDECRFVSEDQANLVTSVSSSQPNPNTVLHKPQMDIDIAHSYLPSSTPGKGHLMLEVEAPWDKYLQWLVLSAELGIIEEGWVNAAKARGFTTLRKPGVKKAKASTNGSSYPELAKDAINAFVNSPF